MNKVLLPILIGSLPSLSAADTLYLQGTIRDFCIKSTIIATACDPPTQFHEDFQTGVDLGSAPPNPNNLDDLKSGAVKSDLGIDKKPDFDATYLNKPGSTGLFSDEVNFHQWYTDVNNVNTSQAITLTLDNTPTSPNVYTFQREESFFPIDDRLFGNQGLDHNQHFTLELHGSFTYQSGGPALHYGSDDDLWVFINNKLAVEIAGTHRFAETTLDLDAQAANLGISTGSQYDIDIFFAERQTVQSGLRIDIPLLDLSPITLADAINQNMLIVTKDAVFADWQLISDNGNVPLRLGQVEVQALPGGDPGLRFVGDALRAFGLELIDSEIGFSVQSLDPSFIGSNSLKVTDYTIGLVGSFLIQETLRDSGNNQLAFKQVAANESSQAPLPPVGVTFDDPQKRLKVVNHLVVGTQDPAASTELFAFEQRFGLQQVPEPGILTLFGIGLAGLGVLTSHRKARKAT